MEQLQTRLEGGQKRRVSAGYEPLKALRDEYEYVRELGRGTQGAVYLVRRITDDQLIAVKELRIDSVSSWKAYELFQREAAVLSSLDVDGVAKCYGVTEFLQDEPPCAYLFQEFIEGETLENMIQRGQRFSSEQVFDLAIQIINILEKLHKHEPTVIHRDLKPSNLIACKVGNGFKVSLIDFGAVANPQIQSGGSTVAGTYGYMPPEQLVGKPSPASDIYSLAAVVVQLLSGESPADMQVCDFRLVIEPHLEQQPNCVVELLRNMLLPDQSRRFCDYDLLRQAFERFKEGVFDQKTDLGAVLPEEYDQKLDAIHDWGQNGMATLWQLLPEKTPRRIPEPYRNLKIKRNDETEIILDETDRVDISSSDITATEKLKKLKNCPHGMLVRENKATRNKIVKISIIAAILSLVFCVFGLAGMVVVSLVFYCAILFSLISCSIKGYERYVPGLAVPKNEMKISMLESVKHLVQNGRKSIATITKIEYLESEDSHIDLFYDSSSNLYMYDYESPSFKVSYSFNPPDDASDKALVHHVIIHQAPEGRLKVGGALPILYWIDPKRNSHVMSMPFPLPVHEVEAINEIFYSGDEA